MPKIPDLTDPRYLDEVGWFLYHEKYERDKFGGSYDNERLSYSRLLLEEVLKYMGRDERWLEGKTVVSIGCGCTGDLASFPAAVKIAIDPLLNVYQKLGMLLEDVEGTSQTVYLSMDSEDLPLLDDYADLVLCRNALDHMPDPGIALREFQRILKNDGALFVSVDIGGAPTPDEPTVFSIESLSALIEDQFKMLLLEENQPPHSVGRHSSVRLLATKKHQVSPSIDKERILQMYEARLT
jgi:ubiquinone/menaquinone biosynthesis C-methylase UbiE